MQLMMQKNILLKQRLEIEHRIPDSTFVDWKSQSNITDIATLCGQDIMVKQWEILITIAN